MQLFAVAYCQQNCCVLVLWAQSYESPEYAVLIPTLEQICVRRVCKTKSLTESHKYITTCLSHQSRTELAQEVMPAEVLAKKP